MTEATANYDQTWKEAIGQYFESFLQFFYPKIWFFRTCYAKYEFIYPTTHINKGFYCF
ncbi:hypothetical protein [Aphanizomenon flos-aquae]|uniref:Uncharacterized protein n=1 Tax=Aphanizomenon flos-aquae FACHB-1040 TaxID=2692887 RepID=A0ABR8C391_APHFL|nr:hypothetical protein [Aphanizomenon flos-aquae]MBD2281492.1 hypothetical protein [Aphanizomenon flos-aquae FACHB-1040]